MKDYKITTDIKHEDIVLYDDKSGFKSLSNEDGLFRDAKEIIIKEFQAFKPNV